MVLWDATQITASASNSDKQEACQRLNMSGCLLTRGATAKPLPESAQERFGDRDRVRGAAAGEVVHHAPQPVGAGGLGAQVAQQDVVGGGGIDRAERLLVGPAQVGAVGVGGAQRFGARVGVEREVDAGGEAMEDAGLQGL